MAAVGEHVSVVAAAGRPVRAEAQNTARQPKLVAMNSKAGRASMMLYLQTVFVAGLAYLFLGESLHGYDLAGAAFIVVGLVLAAIRTKPPQAAETAQTGS